MKQTLYSMTEILGVNRVSAALHRNRPVILTFHGVTSETSDTICNDEGLHLHRPLFERLMGHVARHYNPVPLGRVVDWLEGKDGPLERAVCVTFDDGFRNVLTEAGPALKRYDIPATLFVTTDFVFKKQMLWPDKLVSAIALTNEARLDLEVQRTNRSYDLTTRDAKLRANANLNALCKSLSQAERLALLSGIIERLHVDESQLASAWDGFRPIDPAEMRLLRGIGVTVGAHTCSHPILARLSAAEQSTELTASKQLIEKVIGEACDSFAYPNGGPGDFDDDTRARVIDAGYRCAFTTIKRRVSRVDDRFEIPRCTLTHNRVTVAEFAAELSGFPGTLRALLNRPGTDARSASTPPQAALQS
ncbi:MAG TPA: polysaccharide deacetylase family protein [Candidatus Krumholzibacteria bacterium]|nr:polysaccharide deacetylase family protein [Candidatus Krumholzibacteria bacterium]